jgi:hypothetical protein
MTTSPTPPQRNRSNDVAKFAGVSVLMLILQCFNAPWPTLRERVLFASMTAGLIFVALLLTMLVPFAYLDYIRRRNAEGKGVLIHRILLVLYWFPFLPYAAAGCCLGALYGAGYVK